MLLLDGTVINPDNKPGRICGSSFRSVDGENFKEIKWKIPAGASPSSGAVCALVTLPSVVAKMVRVLGVALVVVVVFVVVVIIVYSFSSARKRAFGLVTLIASC